MREYAGGSVRAMRGKWQCVVRYRDGGDGEWVTVTHMTDVPVGQRGGRTRAEAELRRWRDSLLVESAVEEVSARYEAKIAQIEQGQSGRAATAALHETFEEYARSYVCDRRLGRSTGRPLEASSRRGYLTILDNQLLPYLPQGVRIDEVSTDMVEGLLYELQATGRYSLSTTRKAYNLLRSILAQACERDGLARNPCDGVRAPGRPKPRLHSLPVAEADKLASTLAGMRPTRAVTTAQLALACGMRVGEVAALTMRDCDPSRNIIDVRGSIGRSNGVTERGRSYLKAPKTDAARRQIPMNDELREIVGRRRRLVRDLLDERGLDWSDGLYLVGDLEGHWTTPDNLGKGWSSVSRSLGLVGLAGRSVGLHDLRHTFATYALARGANAKDVQAILGHSSAQMTMDVYASSDPSERAGMMRAVSHR